MIGLGTGLPLFVALGFLVLGARRTHAILGQLARAKAGFDQASRGLKGQLAARAPRLRKDQDDTRQGVLPDSSPQETRPAGNSFPGQLPIQPTSQLNN
jgi:hypothetical protein